jgi:hypothetical protein
MAYWRLKSEPAPSVLRRYTVVRETADPQTSKAPV